MVYNSNRSGMNGWKETRVPVGYFTVGLGVLFRV